jgi:hypothetical protein
VGVEVNAVALLLEAVAESPFAKDTTVIVIEDDSSDSPVHANDRPPIVAMSMKKPFRAWARWWDQCVLDEEDGSDLRSSSAW